MRLLNKFKFLDNQRFRDTIKKLLIFFISFYCFWLPCFSDRYPFNLITYLILGLIAILCSLYLVSSKKIFIVKNICLTISIFLLVSLLSTLINISRLQFSGLREWIRLFLLLVSFVLVFNTFKIINNFKIIYIALLIPLMAFIIYFVLIYRGRIIEVYRGSNERLGSHFNNVNALSSYFAIGYLLSLFGLVYFKNKIKIVLILPMVVFVLIGFTTGSRQFLLSLFVDTFLFMLWWFRKKKIFVIVTLIILVLSIVLIFSIPSLSIVRNKFLFLFNFEDSKDLSAVQRLLMQINALFEGGKTFLIGHGQLGFSAYTSFNGYSHNTYTNAFYESGLIGLFCVVSIFILLIRMSFGLKKRYFGFVMLFIVYYFVVGFFSVWFREKPFYVLLALLCFIESIVTARKDIKIIEITI